MSALLHPRRAVSTRRPVERAAALLLRLVMAEGWRPEPAGRALRAQVHGNTRLLRLLQARVARTMLDRPTTADARALATLEHALADSRRTRLLGWPA